MHQIKFKRISTGSIFKIIFVGSWIGSIPMFLAFGIFGAIGFEFVSWNGEYVVGPKALLITPVVGLFIATILGAIVGAMASLGLWIYSMRKPLSLFCKPVPEGNREAIADPLETSDYPA